MTHVMNLDTKEDTAWTLEHPSVLHFAHLDFSPIACPSYATPTSFINRWMNWYREIYWGAELQHAAVTPTLERLVRDSSTHSLEELQEELKKDKSPAGKGAVQRLDSIRLTYPRIFDSTRNLWSALHETSIYCNVEGPQPQAVRFLFWMLITERFEYLKATNQRDQLHTVVFIDEAPATYSRRQQTITGMASTPVQLLPMTREHGIQFVASTPSWTELDPLVLSQFQVQVLLGTNDGREIEAIRKSFRLTPRQEKFLTSMPLGTAIGKKRGIEHPFIFTYPEFRRTKTPTPSMISAARERTKAFCEANASDAPPAQLQLASNAPSISEPTASPFSPRARAYLTYACEHAPILVSEINEALGLQPMQGDRVKKPLVSMGFLHETRIIVRTGRGRNDGLALTPTDVAYAHLKLQKPRMGRGSGAQHAWLLRQLSKLIPHAAIEVSGADVVTAYNIEKHERLINILAGLGCAIAPNAGDMIAIEVETDPSRTAESNIARNTTNRITTIIAVLPANLKNARKRFAPSAVVDVLALIDHLRP